MSWLAVDKGGCEHIFAEKPCRNESNTFMDLLCRIFIWAEVRKYRLLLPS